MSSAKQIRLMFLNNAHHNNKKKNTLFLVSDITELGRTARVYSELASRTEPTLSDVQLALVDAGRCNVQVVVTSLSPVEVFVTGGYQDF